MKLNALMCFAALILFAPAVLASTTWYVNGTSGSDSNYCLSAQAACKTIGHALSLASSDDSIVVAAGTYKESLSITFSLNITGAGAGTTVIDGGGVASVIAILPNPHTTLVNLSNMTLRNGHASTGAGIQNLGGRLTLNHITVTRNVASSIDAFGAFGAASPAAAS